MNPYKVTEDFEAALCEYTGAPYAVAVNSCTAALLLAVQWCAENIVQHTTRGILDGSYTVEIPSRTYPSVPMAIRHAGGRVAFRDERWRGSYQLKPLPVWDCARRFTSGMYIHELHGFQCVSFATNKIMGIEQGGAILHNTKDADLWFRRMRFDGRTPGVSQTVDTYDLVGHHCLMLPSIAAQLLLKLYHQPKHSEDMPDAFDVYPDLSVQPAFRLKHTWRNWNLLTGQDLFGSNPLRNPG